MASPSERPVNLDLTTFRFPITAIASILQEWPELSCSSVALS